jgi:NAD(P)-dependent dehydrogenase (short-subunit alcohol dehydrogenase family)
MKLRDRVAIITGSSMGIGEAIAWTYAREGARIVVNARSQERADRVVRALQEDGHDAIGIAGDVRERSTAETLADAAIKWWNRLDILVNNAGNSMIGPSETLPEEDWRLTIDTNLTGAFFCAQAAARVMLPHRRGVILNVSSILGEVGLPMRAAYCASKHGLIGLTKVLGTEWARQGIRVVSLDPGYIKTPMEEKDKLSGFADYTRADIERRTPMGRYGSAEEIAQVALFLASDEAAYITGSCVTIDGGWVAYGGW